MSKYDPLTAYLEGRLGQEVPMTFAEIERVIGAKLPPSARKHRPWWSNNGNNNVMTAAWIKAGFRSQRVDIAGERLVFVRAHPSVTETPLRPPGFSDMQQTPYMPPAPAAVPKRHPALGALKGMITVMPGVDLTEPADPEWGRIAYGDDR